MIYYAEPVKFKVPLLKRKVKKAKKEWYEEFYNGGVYRKTDYCHSFYVASGKKIPFTERHTIPKQHKDHGVTGHICFAPFWRILQNFKEVSAKLPNWMAFSTNYSVLDKEEQRTYIKLMRSYGLIDNVVVAKSFNTTKTIYINNLCSMSRYTLYFILSNVRYLNEDPRTANFVLWAHKEHGVHPAVALAITGMQGNLNRAHGYFDKYEILNNKYYKGVSYTHNGIKTLHWSAIMTAAWKIANMIRICDTKSIADTFPKKRSWNGSASKVTTLQAPRMKKESLLTYNPTENDT